MENKFYYFFRINLKIVYYTNSGKSQKYCIVISLLSKTIFHVMQEPTFLFLAPVPL